MQMILSARFCYFGIPVAKALLALVAEPRRFHSLFFFFSRLSLSSPTHLPHSSLLALRGSCAGDGCVPVVQAGCGVPGGPS